MKKILICLTLLSLFQIAGAQTIEEAKKHIYYERFESAKKDLYSIIGKPDASPDAWYWLGEIYLKEKKIDSAKSVLLDGMSNYLKQGYSRKNYPLLLAGWAHLLLDSGQTAEARKEMDEILKAGRYKDPLALWAVARANIDSRNGDIGWAIELLNKAKKRDKKNGDIFLALGDAYRKQIDGANAIKNYNRAIEVDPSLAEAMYKNGRIYKSQNNPEIYIDRFTKAWMIDSAYAPAIYELYDFYFYRNPNKAQQYLDAYIRHSDPDTSHAYMKTDLLYISGKYNEAISAAENILKERGSNAKPRMYKLISNAYANLGDSAAALKYINQYFENAEPSMHSVNDYALKAGLLEKYSPDKTEAIEWYKKALAAEKDKKEKLEYITTLADLNKELGNRDREAVWRERIYTTKNKPSNLDLYNWGIALYGDENYVKADSVFAIYEEKYPEQIYSYLWRGRSNALIDSTMEKGLAIPHYKKLIEIAGKDAAKYKSILITAYGYLGAYEANIRKDYAASLAYFDKILEIDPGNSQAQKYSEILKKSIESGSSKK